MRLAKLMMAVATCAFAATPVLAAPQASVFSAVEARAASEGEAETEAVGALFIAILAIGAIGIGVFAAVKNDDSPTSP